MYLLYCDETNLEERDGDFFVYGENDVARALRTALDFPPGTLQGEHAGMVRALHAAHPHSIVAVPEPAVLTCVPYALGFGENRLYQAIAMEFDPDIFAGRDFVEWLLDGRLHEVNAPKPDLLTLYFSGSVWQHIGLMISPTRVRSKWGTFPVYDHELWQVPASYGDELRFYELKDDSLSLFVEYARALAVDKDIDDVIEEVKRAQ
jgi:hypothetical protein